MNENRKELLGTILELLNNIIARINDISVSYKSVGEFDQERLPNLLDDLNVLAEGVSVFDPQNGIADLYEFGEKLEQMTRALENNDFPLFLDVMNYELKDLLLYWKDGFKKIE